MHPSEESNRRVIEADSRFYVTGGTLGPNAQSYVKRRADADLYNALHQGEFCYVLTSRQMGKSSLMVRAASRLREERTAVVIVDLTAIGQNLTPEQWYYGLLNRVGMQLGPEDELEEFWMENTRLGPLQRWMLALRQIVLSRCEGNIVIFVDEIDAVRSLPFASDEFFAGIRECYNRRAQDSEFGRLSFCLLGVATPAELSNDTRMSPFNIGRRIELNDFTEEEASSLAHGLSNARSTGSEESNGKSAQVRSLALLKRVLYWTEGHPYLTQRLCRTIAEQPREVLPRDVDRLCEELFLTRKAREVDDNLAFVRNRLLKNDVELPALLEFYRQVQRGSKRKDDETNPIAAALKLSGVTKVQQGILKVRNRIYDRVFDREWVMANMPDAELRRQRAAYRKGLTRAAAFYSVVLAVMGFLAVTASNQAYIAHSALEREARQRLRAEDGEWKTRRLLYGADMNLAAEALEAGNLARTKELLKRHGSALRGFEWRYLWQRCQGDSLHTFTCKSVNALAFSPRNSQLAAGRLDGLIEILDVRSRRNVAELSDPDNKESIGVIAFDPAGRILLAGKYDGSIEVWDVALKKVLKRLKVYDGILEAMAFSRDGKLLATGGPHGKLMLWEPTSMRELGSFQGPSKGITSVSFSPDGSTLASCGFDGNIRLWDVASKQQTAVFKGYSELVKRIMFSPDGKFILTGGADGVAKLWNVRSRSLERVLKGYGSEIVAFSPNGRVLATGGGDATVKVWNTHSGAEIAKLRGHLEAILALTFSMDGKLIATGSYDGTVKLWSTEPGQRLPVIKGHRDVVSCVAFSPDGKLVATSSADKTVRLWNVATMRLLTTLKGHRDRVHCVAFSPDGKLLASGGGVWTSPNVPADLKVWNVSTRKEISPRFEGQKGCICSLTFSPDSQTLCTASTDYTVKIWDVASRRDVATLPAPPGRTWRIGLALSPDGTTLAIACGTVELWNIRAKRRIPFRRDGFQGSIYIALSHDGRKLAFNTGDRTVTIWDIADQKEVTTFRGHNGMVTTIAFSPDDRTLATGSRDNTIRLWSFAANQEVAVLHGHDLTINSIAFANDGSVLASASDDGTIRLWHASKQQNPTSRDDVNE